MKILTNIKRHNKGLSKSSINHSRSSPSSKSSFSSSFSESFSRCSSPLLSYPSPFSFSQYSTFSQMPVHLQRSVHSDDNILHWQSSPHKACQQLQVMSSNMDSDAGLHSIQISNQFLIFPHHFPSHVDPS